MVRVKRKSAFENAQNAHIQIILRMRILVFTLHSCILYNPMIVLVDSEGPGFEVIKPFSCSTQLSMKFSLLINTKMPTTCSAIFTKKEFAIVSNIRLISRKGFMLS